MKLTKRKIESADLIRYNANSSGRNTGDCVKRSISLAFDLPYTDTSRLLLQKMHERKADKWNIYSVYNRVIEDLGGSALVNVENKGDPITLEEFVDNEVNENLIYIVLTGSKPGKRDHMVCVRDGKVWDSWDSRKEYVDGYYIVESDRIKEILDVNQYLPELADDLALDVVRNTIYSYVEKHDYSVNFVRTEVKKAKNYQIQINATVVLSANEIVIKNRTYKFSIIIPIEPTSTYDEAEEKIRKVAKQRAYDRMWTINEQEKKLVEEYTMRASLEDLDTHKSDLYFTPSEKRFFNSLPGWVKPLISYISIDSPGQYYDSYAISMHPLPNDSRHSKKIHFNDYDASGIKEQLERYKKTFEIGGIDYEL